MKKLFLSILIFIPFLVANSKSIVLDGKTYTIDTIAHHKVGPGSQYTALKLMSDARLDVFFLKVDATNPNISFQTVLGRDSIYGTERTSSMSVRKSKPGAVYFAGTNGDFFNTTGYVGYPLGGFVADNQVAKIPNPDRKMIAFEHDKIPTIGIMTYNGNVKFGSSTWTLTGVNHLREANNLILYNQYNGKVTRTDSDGTEVLLQLKQDQTWGVNKALTCKVVSIEKNKGSMTIPVGYAVLSGNGTAATNLNTLSVNDEIEINLNLTVDGKNADYSQMIGGDNRNPMLYDGVIETAQVWNELHPRTAIGYSLDKNTIIFCVVDGRGVSAGVTTKQLAQLMKSAGAHTAFNLDGGGSSAMYLKDFGIMNTPSDGNERSVGNGVYAVSAASASTAIAEIQSYNPTIYVYQNGVYRPKFIAYNQDGAVVNKDLKGILLSCPGDVGTIATDGAFVAKGTKAGILTASYNGIETKIRVELLSNKDGNPVDQISEDFSSAEWASEFLKYNPTYIAPGAGAAFTNVNNVDFYFDKYAIEGAIVGAANSPKCPLEGISHGNNDVAIAFRFRNSGESYFELPTLTSAGTMSVHVKNGNSTAATTLTLQKNENNEWIDIHTFNLRPSNDYIEKSMDEVLTFDINSQVPLKLRLSRGNKFINLYRIDVSAYQETGFSIPNSPSVLLQGRKLSVETPTNIVIYNLLGVSVFEKNVEKEAELPALISNGVFIVKSDQDVQKILIKD